MQGEVVIVLNSDDVMGACGEGCGNGACAGANLDDGARREIAESRDDAVDCLRIVEKVLAELGFGGHVLSRW